MNKKLRPSDFLFSFPIRLRSETQLQEAERMKDLGVSSSVDYVDGTIVMPIEDIVAWHDLITNETNLDEVKENGFELVLIETIGGESYVCPLTRKQFEDNYNTHINKLQESTEEEDVIVVPIEEYVDMLDEIAELKQKLNMPWYKKLFNK